MPDPNAKYNAIVLLGGGEPWFQESREIARAFNISVTARGYSQMHIATMPGDKFGVIDLAESHNMYYYNLVITLAKRRVDLGLNASGLTFPRDRPQKWRRKKTF